MVSTYYYRESNRLTNHMEDFLVLMSNYDTALKYTETSLNSSGQAMEKFTAYEDSIAGHTEKFENAFIDLSNTVIDSGLINWFIDLGTSLVKGADGITEFLTPLGTLLTMTGGVLGAKGLGLTNYVTKYCHSLQAPF